MSESKTKTKKVELTTARFLWGVAVWCAFGSFWYWLLEGNFDFYSGLTYFAVVLWPLFLIWEFFSFIVHNILWIIGGIGLLAGGIMLFFLREKRREERVKRERFERTMQNMRETAARWSAPTTLHKDKDGTYRP